MAGVRCDDEHPSAFLLPRLEPIGSRSSPQKFREQTWLRSSVATPAAVCRTANLFASLPSLLPLLLFDTIHVARTRGTACSEPSWSGRRDGGPALLMPPLAGELVRLG